MGYLQSLCLLLSLVAMVCVDFGRQRWWAGAPTCPGSCHRRRPRDWTRPDVGLLASLRQSTVTWCSSCYTVVRYGHAAGLFFTPRGHVNRIYVRTSNSVCARQLLSSNFAPKIISKALNCLKLITQGCDFWSTEFVTGNGLGLKSPRAPLLQLWARCASFAANLVLSHVSGKC